MLRAVSLLLPALIPSWRFFDAIGPSPRVEYALLPAADAAPRPWREFRPRPAHLSLAAMLGRLVWNPRWNETLFLVSCAERLMDQPTAHSEDEIFRRIDADVGGAASQPWLCFRLVFLSREGDAITRDVLFQSEPRRRADVA
ncbi:MAG: hypothetical protein KKE02_21860 [Alphaproteobacteria bacterium]|nr:hypothetical protein [Alphaproteobacteria bacterium]MBU1515990.1 hypothetical protein [Alphaproteobacteria bacterium]MBU2092795.1 hypothetical protein [Alphaproteobacteria bacterium]MBU2153680.1 hypothetical protein [Alphaproteobacteria bacterium]MBU2308308.1 hypothetical protein [Alphaproteobacteria bacterium]